MRKEKNNSDKVNEKEPMDDEMLAEVYLTAVNKQNPIDFTEILKAHRKETETRQYIKRVEELVKPKSKVTLKKEISTHEVEVEVPASLLRDDVESFLRILERTTMKDRRGKELRILDRSSLPWKFATKALAAYIAQVLIDKFPVTQSFADIKTVAGYKCKNLHSLLSDSGYPTGAKEVDMAYKKYKELKNNVI